MRIVVLDGFTMNPGDLSWQDLEKLGNLSVYERTPPENVLERAGNAEVLLTNKTVLTRDHMACLPTLRYIGVLATGYNVVDTEAAKTRGIVVTNVPAYSTRSVAQTVFAHILNLTQGIAVHSDSVRRGDWCRSADFSYALSPLTELAGKTMGIIGFGRIGKQVAEIARAFGMKVIINTRTAPADSGVCLLSIEELFRQADVLSLHCPLTPRTQALVNRDTLALMKPTSLLINTGRGQLVDEYALAEALNAGSLAGAGLDVLSTEPPGPDNPLLQARNCFITPHLGWATKEARQRLYDTAVQNVRAYLCGRPVNTVNA